MIAQWLSSPHPWWGWTLGIGVALGALFVLAWLLSIASRWLSGPSTERPVQRQTEQARLAEYWRAIDALYDRAGG